jgi:hypothetical protein
VFDETGTDPREAVTVGNHDFRDISAHAGVQNGPKARPREVDSAADVGYDSVTRKPFPQECNLPFKIRLLFGRTDACVADTALFTMSGPLHGQGIPPVTPLRFSMRNLPVICPVPQRLDADSKGRGGLPGHDPLHILHYTRVGKKFQRRTTNYL